MLTMYLSVVLAPQKSFSRYSERSQLLNAEGGPSEVR